MSENGFGQTAYDSSLDMSDFSKDVEAVLRHLHIDEFALFGISGGGPYTAKIASRNVGRLLSVHMAATAPSLDPPREMPGGQSCIRVQRNAEVSMQFFGSLPTARCIRWRASRIRRSTKLPALTICAASRRTGAAEP